MKINSFIHSLCSDVRAASVLMWHQYL